MGKKKVKDIDNIIGYCKCCGYIAAYESAACSFCGSEWNVISMMPPFTEEDYYVSEDICNQVDEFVFKEYIEFNAEYDPVKAEERIQKGNSIYFCKCCGKIWARGEEICSYCGTEWNIYPIKPPLTFDDYTESEEAKSQIHEIIFKEYIEPSGVYDPIKARERIKSEVKEEEENKKRLQEALSSVGNSRVTCPYCGSQNIHRFNPMFYPMGPLGGFYSLTLGKQWKCGNCKSHF